MIKRIVVILALVSLLSNYAYANVWSNFKGKITTDDGHTYEGEMRVLIESKDSILVIYNGNQTTVLLKNINLIKKITTDKKYTIELNNGKKFDIAPDKSQINGTFKLMFIKHELGEMKIDPKKLKQLEIIEIRK
jgi:hypothetical protein